MEVSQPLPVHLSVSIVLHNSSLELLQRALQSLHHAAEGARQAGGLGRVTVDVVDNSADQAYREQIVQALAAGPRSDFFQVEYSSQPLNRGFGSGHNSVIQGLHSDFHLVLNPDVELADDTLRVGLSCIDGDDSIVLLSPRVLGGGGDQEFLCKRYPSVLALLVRGFAWRWFRKRLERYEMRDVCSGDQPADVVLASGCFMLVRTAALRAVGGFDESYFLYFEDFDLSLRLGGHGRLVFNPAMRIIHHGGYAASKGWRHVKYFVESGITFFNRHGWRWI